MAHHATRTYSHPRPFTERLPYVYVETSDFDCVVLSTVPFAKSTHIDHATGFTEIIAAIAAVRVVPIDKGSEKKAQPRPIRMSTCWGEPGESRRERRYERLGLIHKRHREKAGRTLQRAGMTSKWLSEGLQGVTFPRSFSDDAAINALEWAPHLDGDALPLYCGLVPQVSEVLSLLVENMTPEPYHFDPGVVELPPKPTPTPAPAAPPAPAPTPPPAPVLPYYEIEESD